MKQQLIDSISKSLVDFGYHDASPDKILDIWDAYERGDEKMPHQIIGRFAAGQLDALSAVWPDLIKRGGTD